MENRNILPALTTAYESENYSKIDEITKYKIKEISLFLTGLDYEGRKKLYNKLEKLDLKSIPHVHLRNDMSMDEIDYLYNKFKVKCFNIHPKNDDYPYLIDLSKYKSIVYFENTLDLPTEEELNTYAGLCLDFSHLEDMYLNGSKERSDEKILSILETYKIGCGHISAIMNKKQLDITYPERMIFSSHKLGSLSELDYMKKYINYLPDFISLELVNSFSEQIDAKKYLEEILNI